MINPEHNDEWSYLTDAELCRQIETGHLFKKMEIASHYSELDDLVVALARRLEKRLGDGEE